MKYIHHPLIKPESLEERTYQLSIALRALDGNTMVVLPTGLGKTAVALLTVASRLHNTGGKILMLAPTKPLVEQHLRFFEQYLLEPDDGGEERWGSGCAMFTGETKTTARAEAWKNSRFIFATPQVIKNDCIAGRYGLEEVTLLIVDECHRAVGNYSYVFLAGHYNRTAKKPLLLAMTASPGSDQEKVLLVCENLGISIVESRNEEDADVRPYIHEREVHYLNVDLPEELAGVIDKLNQIVENRLEQLASMDYAVPKPNKLSMKSLNSLNAQIQRRIQKKDSSAYTAASMYAELMKLRHAISTGESQGSTAVRNYLIKLSAEGQSASGTKASKRLSQEPLFQDVLDECGRWKEELLPKPGLVLDLVREQLEEYPDSRVIVFATYRDTVQLLVDHLNSNGIECRRFVGQASKDGGKGLSQKKQIETLAQFRNGDFKVLVATSVGEEGLDVPSTDLVIFYEAVPSEIRSIQRKGRTGRHESGSIFVLITKGTSDEVFRWVSNSREKAMRKGIKNISTPIYPLSADVTDKVTPTKGQTSIEAFVPEGSPIVADDRETASRVVEHLYSSGVNLRIERLEFGDYAIGDRILVERKTCRDFMDTLVERDLLGQIRKMADAALRPVLIIEGEGLYTQRNINPNAVRGALAAIAVDMGVAIMFTSTQEETAEMLYVLARRENSKRGGEPHNLHHNKSYRSKREHQEYILSAFPGIGLRHARILLNHFGTLQNVINADRNELMTPDGIGEKIAMTIEDISHSNFEE